MGVIETILIGFLGGVAGWGVTRAFLAPRIAWSNGISRTGKGEEGDRYQYKVKVQNVGWFRSITQIELSATLRYWTSDSTNQVMHLEVSTDEIPRLNPGQNSISTLRVRHISDDAKESLKKYGHVDVADSENRKLEQLLGEEFEYRTERGGVKRPDLTMRAIVTDGWSGVTLYRQSMHYYLEDIHADQVFQARLGFVATLWRRARGISDRARYFAYHTKLREKRRPSLTLVPHDPDLKAAPHDQPRTDGGAPGQPQPERPR